jgi:hypothetical protein
MIEKTYSEEVLPVKGGGKSDKFAENTYSGDQCDKKNDKCEQCNC